MEVRSQDKSLSPKLARVTSKYRESQWTLHGNQCHVREAWTVTDGLLEAQCRQVKNSRGIQSSGHLKLLWVLLPGALLDSYSEYWRKTPHASGKGRGRGTIFEILLSILFLTRSTLKRNYLTRASHAGALSDPNWSQLAVAFHIGERKSPTPAPSSHPAHLKRGVLRSTCEVHSSEA